MTIPAITELIAAHRAGRHAEAEAGYLARLEADPDDVDALHFLGLIRFQQGAPTAAVELMVRAVALAPHYVDARANLAHVYRRLERRDEAREAYRAVLAAEPEHVPALNGLALLERAEGRLEAALAVHDRLLALAPDYADGHYNRGQTLSVMGRDEDAVGALERALALDPSLTQACLALARLLVARGRVGEAIALYRQVDRTRPGLESVRHMLAALTGEDVPTRASDGHMREMFDAFAETFDLKLAALEYRAPALVAATLARRVGAPAGRLQIVDLGCGTGLSGAALAAFARRLVGVDVSSGMLDRARGRGIYDALIEAEIVEALGDLPRAAFDVAVAVDVLVYFGALDEVCTAVADALKPGGYFVFTTERASIAGAPVTLGPHGRYGHDRDYLIEVAETAGLEVCSLEACVPRREAGADVAGWCVSARRVPVRAGERRTQRTR